MTIPIIMELIILILHILIMVVNPKKFIGQALKKYPRESFNLATKLPIWLIKGVRLRKIL